MRSISSARAFASIGTPMFSFRIVRSRSSSCTTLTSLASVNSRLQKVIVTWCSALCGAANNDVRDRGASLLRRGRSVIFVSTHSGNSIQTGIFSRLPVGSITETAPSPRFGLRTT